MILHFRKYELRFLNLPVIMTAVKESKWWRQCHPASSLGLHLYSAQYTSDSMETQADLGETSTLTFLFKYLENDICCVSCTATLLQAEKLSIMEKSKLGTHCKSRLHQGRRETCFYMGLTVVVLRGRWQAATTASLQVLQLCDVIYLWNLSEQHHGLTNVASVWENVTTEICTQEKTV